MAFGFYKQITINHLQCGTVDSANWPLRIAVTDADLKVVGSGGSVQSSLGFDIRPFSDIGLTTALTFELVNYVSTTGQLEMYVKIPTLTVATDVVIYLAFGDSGITTDGSSNTTWDTGFVGVYHFGRGSVINLLDSSTKGNNGTNNGGVVAAGYEGGGVDLISSSYIDISGLANYFGGKSQLTVELDVKPTSPTGNATVLFTIGTLDVLFGISNASPFFRLNNTLRDGVHGGLSPAVETPDNGYVESVWNRTVATVDGAADTHKIYRDGVQKATATAVFDTFDPAAAGYVRLGLATSTVVGQYDELRISDVVRSPSWITANENNRKPSSTFLTFGTKTAVGGGAVGRSQSFIFVG